MLQGERWTVVILGIAHMAFGLVRFKVPLAAAVAAGDPGALKTIAHYALGASVVGIAAFPASPLWSLLVLGLALLAV